MSIDYYQTQKQQKLAFQKCNSKVYSTLLDMFSEVDFHWNGGTLFYFNKGIGDRVLFTFLLDRKKKLKLFLDPCNSEAEQEFKELARQNIRTVKGVLNFIIDWQVKEKKDILKNDNIDYDLTDDGTGKKYDSGKPMVGTLTDVFSRALMAVGACIEYGTHKYPNPKNWQLVDDGIKRYRDAMIRHLLKYNAGIDKDEETKLPHLAHMAWNALAILELYMQEHKDELDKDIFK